MIKPTVVAKKVFFETKILNILFKTQHFELELECSSKNSSRNKLFVVFEVWFLLHFCNFRKVWNRTNSKIFVSSEYLETPVFDPKTLVFASKTVFFDPKTRVFDPNLFRKIFTNSKIMTFSEKFLNFEHFRNLQKWKVWKNPSFAGP